MRVLPLAKLLAVVLVVSRRPQRSFRISRKQNRVQNTIEIPVYLAVVKPNGLNTLFVKLDFTIQVVRLGKVASMAGTIQLDGEMSFGTKEIDDAISYWNLAPEL